ncbi:MAG: hypothetical protein M1820_005055 [Bogoriella megaspora]|nr:MAG: hypothetical protein M1820_005055 [Bogoriella megaspora]
MGLLKQIDRLKSKTTKSFKIDPAIDAKAYAESEAYIQSAQIVAIYKPPKGSVKAVQFQRQPKPNDFKNGADRPFRFL